MNPRLLPCAPRTRVAPPFVAPLGPCGNSGPRMRATSGESGSTFMKYMSDFKTIPSENYYPLQLKVNFSKSDYFNVYMKCPPESGKKTNENQESESNDVDQRNVKGCDPCNKNSPPQKSQKVLPYQSSRGGYSTSSKTSVKSDSALVILFLHGAGFSSLSWALLVKSLSASVPGCYLVAIDIRGHGDSRTSDESDFSFETLSEDVCRIYEALLQDGFIPGGGDEAEADYTGSGTPICSSPVHSKVLLVGHSMGGALAAYIGAKKADRFEHVVGVCVIDVVEGSAIEALNGMKNVLQSRPKSFASEEEAVEWSVRSGYIKKRESAKISMIGQIITQSEANKRQAADIIAAVQKKEESYSQPSHYPHVSNRDLGALQEEEDEEFGEEGEEDAGEHRETGTQKIETQKMTSSTNSNRQVKPHPESTGVSSSNKRKDAQENTTTTGTARKSEDNDGTELDTNNGKSQQETSQSVVPRDTTLKSEPEFQSAKYGTETTSNSVEAYKLYYVSTEGYNEVYSGTSDEDSKQYPNCEVIYDIRSEDNKMTVSKGGKTGSQGSNQKDADDASQKEGEKKDEEIKDPERYTWRIDLFKTEPYWRSWFTGLSRNFLDSPGPKLLILAGVDRLDKELTVAQMQGKFQMLVLPKAGHAVQEDAPEKVADALASFIQRHRMAPTDSSQYQVVYPGC